MQGTLMFHYLVSHDLFCSLGCGNYLPILSRQHSSGFTSQLLIELIAHESSTESHLHFILFGLRFDYWTHGNKFQAHKVCPSQLLRKKVTDVKIYKELIGYGMQVKVEDIAYTVKDVNVQLKLVKLLVDKCKYEYSDRNAYDKIIETVKVKTSESLSNKKQHKCVLSEKEKQLIIELRKGTKVIINCMIVSGCDMNWLLPQYI